MKRIFVWFMLIGFLLSSCGAKKDVRDGAVLKYATTKKVIKHYKKGKANFNTLNANLKGSYDDGEQSRSINLNMRMKKDETIWLSAKIAGVIPIAKLLVTPDRVQFYEKINKRYFDGDFDLLSHWFGIELDFEKFQNLLLGQVLYDLDQGGYDLKNTKEGYLLSSINNWNLEKSYLIDKTNFRLKEQHIKKIRNNDNIDVHYPTSEKVGGAYLPQQIEILANKDNGSTQIEIRFRSFELNQSVSYPFKLPSKGYKEISVK